MSAGDASGRVTLAHVFATFGRGGPQVRAVQLMRHLGDGVSHVVMAMDGCTDARAMLDEGLDVQFVEPPQTSGLLATRRAQMAWLQTVQPDAVFTYNWGAIETVAAAKKLRLPLVHHEDGFGPEEAQTRLRRRSWIRRLLLRKTPVIVPSAVLRDIATREWRLRDVHHLVNGVDLQRFAPGGPVQAPLVLGSVGGLRGEKDYANLLRAAALLDDDVRVCLVGSGPLEADLRALSQQLGLGARVEFAGHTDDTAASYRRFSVFVLSSRTEQMPIAMLEAMASGLPVVATDVGDVRAILDPIASDCVAPKEDPQALADTLRPVLQDATRRQQLGKRNREAVEQHYEAGTCLERFCAVYRAGLAAARQYPAPVPRARMGPSPMSPALHADIGNELLARGTGDRRAGLVRSLRCLPPVPANAQPERPVPSAEAQAKTGKVEALRTKTHGPKRTLMKRLLGPMHVTGTFWYRWHYWCTWYPDWFISLMVWLHTWFFWAVLWGIRRAVANNLAVAVGPCGWFERQRRIWRTFNQFAWCHTERYEQFRPQKKMRFDFAGDATYEIMKSTDRGFVFFTAHFGNWEMGPLVDELPGGRKFHVVREPEMSQGAQEFVQELFDKHPQRDQFVVHYAGADMTLGAKLLMALRKGDVIGMPGDRPRTGMETMRTQMFGKPMDLPPGPVALARAANALMVPVFVFREGRRHYRIELWEPIEVANSDDKQRDIEAGVQAMAAACEQAIRRRPHHWFCWADLWTETAAAPASSNA